MVGRQTPFLALIVPLILVGMVDGRRGMRPTGPPRWSAALAFAIGQFACSNYMSVELTDIVASLLSAARCVACSCASGSPASRCWASGRFSRPAIAGAATARRRRTRPRCAGASDDHRDSRATSSAPTRRT